MLKPSVITLNPEGIFSLNILERRNDYPILPLPKIPAFNSFLLSLINSFVEFIFLFHFISQPLSFSDNSLIYLIFIIKS